MKRVSVKGIRNNDGSVPKYPTINLQSSDNTVSIPAIFSLKTTNFKFFFKKINLKVLNNSEVGTTSNCADQIIVTSR